MKRKNSQIFWNELNCEEIEIVEIEKEEKKKGFCVIYRREVVCGEFLRWDERSKKETFKSEIWITRH